jgi:hypothetical protein
MWILQLNPITSNAENIVPVYRAETKEELEALLARETAGEEYTDVEEENRRDPAWPPNHWRKHYKRGGPLEWFNPPGPDGVVWYPNVYAIIDVGTLENWMEEAKTEALRCWNNLLREVPQI